MKTSRNKFFAFLLVCVAFFARTPKSFVYAETLDIIFTHDIHSFLTETAKIKPIIDAQKEANPRTIVLDAGDIAMGTLTQTVFAEHAVELRMLGMIGVDVTTTGNHEFDFGASAFAKMFDSALQETKNVSNVRLPKFALCNVDWSQNDEYTQIVKKSLVENYGAKDYVMVKKGNLNIAVLGVFGKDALFCAPTCSLTFEDPIIAVKRTVAKIKTQENADAILCVSHSGTNKNPKKSEDQLLAKAVPELDVIISGHTHTSLKSPIIQGNTIIASCGAYNKNLGKFTISKTQNGRWQLVDYNLIPIKNQNLAEDQKIIQELSNIYDIVDKEYLAQFDFKSNQVLSRTTQDLDENHQVGYLMAQCMFDTTKKMNIPVDFTVVPSGVLRGTYKKGNITVRDVFESYSLGIGPDGVSGYPLLAFYITGKELKDACEIDCSLSPIMDFVRLFFHGISYEYNPRRMFLNKVTQVYKVNDDGTKEKIQDNKIYCGITDLYTGQMLSSVLHTTHGLLSIVPKTKNKEKIQDLKTAIIYNSNGTELKGWISIANGMNNKQNVGDWTTAEQDAIVSKSSLNPIKLFCSPSKLALVVYVIILVLIATIIIIIVACKKQKKHPK